MFNKLLFRDEQDEYTRIFVGAPKRDKDSFTYLVKAFDNQGFFEVRRRMKDFYTLREVFQKRLPGLFIPSLPPKTIFSKSNT